MTTHTPAPWKTKETHEGEKLAVFGGGIRIADMAGSVNPKNAFHPEEVIANARLIESAPELESALCNLLEWAKGNRGSKSGNPYGIPEVKSALQLLAKIQGVENYLNAKTKE